MLPGQEGKVTLNVKTNGLSGALGKFADITTNDPLKPVITVRLQLVVASPGQIEEKKAEGRKVGPFRVTPTDSLRARASAGGAVDIIYTIINEEASPLKLTGVTTDSDGFTAKIETLEEGRRYLVRATSTPAVKVGTHFQKFKVATTAPEMPEIELRLEAFVTAIVYANPTSLNLGVIPASSPNFYPDGYAKFVWIRQPRGASLELKKITATLPFIKIEPYEENKGQVFVLTVALDKEKRDKMTLGEHSGKLVIETNNPQVPLIEVPLKVTFQ